LFALSFAGGNVFVVTSMGSFAAAASPSLLGFIQSATGSLFLGLQISAGIVLLAVVVMVLGAKASDLKENHH
jgi:hypothetical protein